MKSTLISQVMLLTTLFAQRRELRADAIGCCGVYEMKPLTREVMLRLIELYKRVNEEIDLYNRHACAEDRIEVPLGTVSGAVVKFPEIQNASKWSTLINEGVELNYVSGSRYEWSVFMYWWSGYNKRKIERLTWYKYLNGT